MLDGLFLGLDCGTQGLKALLLDGASGRVVAIARRKYGVLPNRPPGVSEQHPRTWIAAAEAAIGEALAASGVDARRVKAIAVSGQQHGCVALDAKDRVLRPAKLWNDVSTAAEAAEIVEACGGAAAFRSITGNALPPGFTASKVLAMKRSEPSLFARCARVLLPHDYLNLWLTGAASAEAGDASGTGYFDLERRDWSPAVMSAIDARFHECVPPIVEAGSVVGEVRSDLARKLGLPAGVVVGHGGGDNMMSALGTGNVREGIVTVSLGTSGTAFAFSEKSIVDPRGEIAAFCDSTGGYLPLLCIQSCTTATEAVKRLLKMNDAALDAAAASAHVGSGGAVFLPFFGGERTPNLPEASGAILGLEPATLRRENLARAAMEGPALGLAYGIERLRRLGVEPAEIRITGGGARSATWRRICADAFGLPVVGLAVDESAALGAAICALWCAARASGARVEAEEVADRFVQLDASTRVEPEPSATEEYRAISALREGLVGDLRPAFRRLASRRTP